MFDDILQSDNPLIRYGFSTLIVFGLLYFLGSSGIVPMPLVWLISVIIFVMVLLQQVGRNKATFG